MVPSFLLLNASKRFEVDVSKGITYLKRSLQSFSIKKCFHWNKHFVPYFRAVMQLRMYSLFFVLYVS